MVDASLTWEWKMPKATAAKTGGPATVTSIKKPSRYEGESKEAAFRRLGRSRFVKCVTRIRSLAFLTNRSAYAYDADQVEVLITSLRNEVDALETAFLAGLRRGKEQVEIDL